MLSKDSGEVEQNNLQELYSLIAFFNRNIMDACFMGY